MKNYVKKDEENVSQNKFIILTINKILKLFLRKLEIISLN